MECPSKECHTNVQGMKTTLYGTTGSEGLVGCVSKKISTNLGIAFLAFVLTFSGGFILYGLAAEKKQNECVNENKEKIAVIQKDLEHIAKDQKEMKEVVKRIEQNQLTESKLIDVVKKALQDN